MFDLLFEQFVFDTELQKIYNEDELADIRRFFLAGYAACMEHALPEVIGKPLNKAVRAIAPLMEELETIIGEDENDLKGS